MAQTKSAARSNDPAISLNKDSESARWTDNTKRLPSIEAIAQQPLAQYVIGDSGLKCAHKPFEFAWKEMFKAAVEKGIFTEPYCSVGFGIILNSGTYFLESFQT